MQFMHLCKHINLLQMISVTELLGTHAETKIAELANSVDLDEVAHNEPSHLDLHYLPSSL